MGSARYVGRVGALAVTLGVGIAVTSGWGAPVAAAEPSDSSPTSDSSATSGPASAPKSSSKSASKSVSKDTSGAATSPKSDDDDNHDDEKLDSATSARTTKTKKRSKAAVSEAAPRVSSPEPTTDVSAESAEAEPIEAVESPPTPDSPTMVAAPIAESVDATDAPISSTSAPTPPAGEAPLWTLAAFARRELEEAFVAPKIDPERVAAQTTSQPLTTPPAEDSPATADLTAEPLASALPPQDQVRYTGQPSLVSQVVVLGLRVVDLVLKPFGGLLAFTSLDIPIFTDGIPPFFLRHGLDVSRTEFQDTPVWTLQPASPSEKVIIGLHGGAYVAQASLFHWWTYTDMARDTGATVVVPLYPLLPEGNAAEVVPSTADFIAEMIALHGADNVSVIGDSAGGGLALAATQELVRRGSPVPSRMVLLAPWLDATVSDPRSASVDGDDPLLDVASLQRDGAAWGGDLGADHPWASPLYGSLAGLPETTVFSGSLDLLTPDSLRLMELTQASGLDNFTFDFRKGQIHDWPIFAFLPDAIAVRPDIYRGLLGP